MDTFGAYPAYDEVDLLSHKPSPTFSESRQSKAFSSALLTL